MSREILPRYFWKSGERMNKKVPHKKAIGFKAEEAIFERLDMLCEDYGICGYSEIIRMAIYNFPLKRELDKNEIKRVV